MSELKNRFANNVSWFCLEGSITLGELKHDREHCIDDEFEVYGEDANGNEGSVNVDVVQLLESAHVVICEKESRISKLEGMLKHVVDSDFCAGEFSVELEALLNSK